ncbi:hypothetical protein TWF481_009120 [Arthrobotrys musiformis]|uniref:Mid2 domain-containing protein n=1 Tax=Arthrobotrys musiformis TaxID=47236 RepID=A0AAV9W441_9PEZI
MRGVVFHPIIFSFVVVFLSSIATPQITETLAELGTLHPSNPPPDCSSFSVRSTGLIQFGDTRTIYSTLFQQGCHFLSRTSCCPQNYGLRGFYSPASGCPPGYTQHSTLTFSGRRYIGLTYELSEKRGAVCCPSVVDPVTKYDYTPGLGFLCDASVIKRITGQETFESWYQASAVVVVTEAGSPESTPAETSSIAPPSSTSAVVRTGGSGEVPSETGSSPETKSTPLEPTSSGSLKSSGPGVGDDSQPPDGSVRKKGLSTGAIAGIAVGVTIPVLSAIIYAVYMFGRRRGRATVPEVVDTYKYGGEAQDGGMGGIQSDSKIG